MEGEQVRGRERGAYMVAEGGEGDRLAATGAFYRRKDLGYAGSLFVRDLGHRKERGEREGGIELSRNVD